jgi:hypothetical protein
MTTTFSMLDQSHCAVDCASAALSRKESQWVMVDGFSHESTVLPTVDASADHRQAYTNWTEGLQNVGWVP